MLSTGLRARAHNEIQISFFEEHGKSSHNHTNFI